jgi:YidC/Oxa1 family membrane protein insertase
MLDFIAIPMGSVMKFIYDTLAFQNYGIAIILFTVTVKTIMLPLTIKQYQSTARISELQPQLQQLQKNFKGNQGKLNEEIAKFYKENHISPAGGCLPLLIQMPILFSLYYVISQPLKYMAGISAEVIEQLFATIPEGAGIANMKDLSIISYYGKHPELMNNVSQLLKPENLFNMNFLGINLGSMPSQVFTSFNIQNLLLLLIPVLAAATSYLTVKYSTAKASLEKADNGMQASMQRNITLMSPLMSGVIAFTVPAGLGFYWIVGNMYQIIQHLFMNRFVIKKPAEAKATQLPDKTVDSSEQPGLK